MPTIGEAIESGSSAFTAKEVADVKKKIPLASWITFTEIDLNDKVVDPDRAPHFSFRIANPNKLEVSMIKIETYQLTKAGYDRQFWQNDLFKLAYSGSTGAFMPRYADHPWIEYEGGRPLYDIRDSKAWQVFSEFFEFYQMVGSLNSFKFSMDADNNPNRIQYSFEYTGFPRSYEKQDT
jgi:hypothetical protein